MDWRRRVTIGFGCLVVIGIMTWAGPPPQDADLMPSVVPVPDEQNAYPLVLQIAAAYPLSSKERYILGQQFDGNISSATVVAGLIARSGGTLKLFAELSRRTAYQDPHYLDLANVGPQTPVPPLYAVVRAATLVALRSDALLKQGRATEALAGYLQIVDVGRMFARGPQLLSSGCGMLLMDRGASRALQAVKSGRLDQAKLLNAAARLSAPSNAAAGLQEGFRYVYVEHAYISDHAVDSIGKGKDPKGLFVRAEKYLAKRGLYSLKTYNGALFRKLIADSVKPCLHGLPPSHELLPIGFRPYAAGRILYNIALPQYEKFCVRRCEVDSHLTAAAVATAAQAYRRDNGRFPTGLGELTPVYLPVAPVDPYTGVTPHYSANTGEILSDWKGADAQ